ncbi:MAG: hypothetical protein JSS99_13205 [Actinobacteria bacterium]|nr:hypothetical protein [Actinomycetota bacterium]
MTPPAATAAARRAVVAPRPARRVSGPVRRPVAVPRPAPRRAPEQPLGARALEWLRALPDHRLLDRLIGGRVWIVLLGTLLVGIVTMQLTLLRWNAAIGRAVEQSSQLEQRNAALRLSISQLSDTERIVSLATQMGFVMPPQGSPRFLTASAGDADRALTTMRVPDPNAAATAAAQLAAQTQSATGTATATGTTTATGPTGSTTATTTPTTTTPSATTAPVAATTPATATPTTAAAPVTSAAAGGASVPPTQNVGPQG